MGDICWFCKKRFAVDRCALEVASETARQKTIRLNVYREKTSFPPIPGCLDRMDIHSKEDIFSSVFSLAGLSTALLIEEYK